MTEKVAIYIRVSTQHQIDKDSLLVQRRELIAYSELVLNIKEYEVFEDPGFSAKNTDRPQFQAMMTRIRAGEFSHLLVWKIDRISRNLLDFSEMYRELKKCGVAFVSKNEQFDTSSAVGEAMLKIILVFAELERNMTAERVTAVMLSRANNGQWNGGKIPYGYEYSAETKEFTPLLSEAQIVQIIYDKYEEKRSLIQVAKYLNDNGVRSRTGSQWSAVTVHKILTSVFYIGSYRYNVRDEENGFKTKDKSEWITIENHHPPIVTVPQFERVQKLLQSNSRLATRQFKTSKNVHVFSGLLVCGKCGCNMSANTGKVLKNGWAVSQYACHNRRKGTCDNKYISELTLGPFVFNLIQIAITSQDISEARLEAKLKKALNVPRIEGVSKLIAKTQPKFYTPPSDTGILERDKLEERKRKIENAMIRLKNLYLFSDTPISEKDYIIENERLSKELETINNSMSRLPEDSEILVSRESYRIMATEINRGTFDYIEHGAEMNREVMRDFIRAVVQSITVLDGKVTEIVWKNGAKITFPTVT